jgi:hypothetical protein
MNKASFRKRTKKEGQEEVSARHGTFAADHRTFGFGRPVFSWHLTVIIAFTDSGWIGSMGFPCDATDALANAGWVSSR